MEIQIIELEPCKLSVQCVADAGEILEKRGQVLQLFKKAPVPGFRPGKGSLDAIKIHYKSQIEESLKRGLAEDAYHNALFEKKLKPHGSPYFKSLIMADGKFTCEFDLYIKPDFELAPYKNLEIPKPHEDFSSFEFGERMLQELRRKFGEAIPYTENDFVQEDDNVIVDYEGFIDGHKVDNLSAQGEMLTVGHSQLSNFDNNLLGMTLGESREFDFVVPNNGLPSLAGKKIHFKATINMGSKTELCPLDDTLAVKMGKKDFTELKEFVSAAAMGRTANAKKLSLNESITRRLVSDNKITIPNWLSLSEARYLAHSAKIDWETLSELDKNKYLEVAENNVRLSLILDRIRELEPEAQLTDQEVFDIIKQNLVKTNIHTSVDDVIKEMNRTGYMQILFSRIKDEFTVDFLVKNTKVIE